LLVMDPILPKVGASGKPGTVQTSPVFSTSAISAILWLVIVVSGRFGSRKSNLYRRPALAAQGHRPRAPLRLKAPRAASYTTR